MKWVTVIALGLLFGGAAACAWLSGLNGYTFVTADAGITD
jgi:hypothetical protein